ncbi:hypothetical protein [Anaeromicrobium sediminis]|nr:hypothetical protein [Anaeromicrobium sediminis]
MEKTKSEGIKVKDMVLSGLILLIMTFQMVLILQNTGFISY